MLTLMVSPSDTLDTVPSIVRMGSLANAERVVKMMKMREIMNGRMEKQYQ
jgi:hypothetical protein